MRAIVTGGAGFIGSHVVDALVARGDEVVVLDDLSHGKRENVNPGAELVVADIRDARGRRERLRRGPARRRASTWPRRPTCASRSRGPDFDGEVNVLGTIRLLEAAREHGTRIVFSSTGGAIYGECARAGAGEDAPREPALPVRNLEARRGGVPRDLQPPVRERAHGASLRQRLRARARIPHGEAGVVAIFLGLLARGEAPHIFGDGRSSATTSTSATSPR